MLRQIPVADLQELVHLSVREVKTLLSESVGREIEPSSRHNGQLSKTLETFTRYIYIYFL